MIYVEDGAPYAGENQAWIGYENAITAVTASSESSEGPVENTQDGLTFDYWMPGTSGDATLTLTVGTHDYIAIAAHNCDDECDEVRVTVDGQQVMATENITDRSPIWLHPQQRDGDVTLTFANATSSLRVGVIYCGLLLQMQRTEWQGRAPLTHQVNENRVPSTSDTGQYLGQILTREFYTARPSFDHLESEWYRDNVPAFVRASQTQAFFYAWRPGDYPREIAYGWRTGQVKPNNTGPAGLMSMSFDFEGVSHEQ